MKLTMISRVAIVAALLLFPFLSSCHNVKFDSHQWKEWEGKESTMHLRWDMRKDLVRQHELVGMTVGEIKELLGVPANESNMSMSYDLGPARRGIDYGYLRFTLENDNVVKFQIGRH